MILKLSEKAASVLAEKNSLDPDDTALMQYGLFIILSHILYAIICIICSAVFGVITQGVIFYLAFSFLRSYAGGYHASTEARCIAFSSAAILVCVYCMSLCERFDLRIPFAVSAAAASIALLVFAPVDCREKPFSQKEHCAVVGLYYRRCRIRGLVVLQDCVCALGGNNLIRCNGNTRIHKK